MPRAGLDAAAVIDAAARLSDADGLQSLTLARLAQTLGIRPPSLYAHVAGLEDVRRRLAERGAAELAVALRRAAAGRARSDALHAIADAYRAYAHEHPGTYMALQYPHPTEAATELVEVVLAVLRGYGLKGDDAIHGARVVRSALHGFVTLESDEGFGIALDLDESFRRLVAAVDGGLAQGPNVQAR